MRSRAAIGNHPIHPMLIAFPVSFLTGSVVFDILSRSLPSEPLYTTAYHCLVAGLVTGAIAAIPGLVDYTLAIPSSSRAKKKARVHMAVNSSALVLFLVSLLTWPAFVDRTVASMIPAYLGLALLGFGGWLGGSLVYEERIGVVEDIGDAPKGARDTGWPSHPSEYEVHTHH